MASEPIGPPERWTALEPGQLLHVGPDLTPSVTTVLPDPLAHALTLDDLDLRAVAAQQEK